MQIYATTIVEKNIDIFLDGFSFVTNEQQIIDHVYWFILHKPFKSTLSAGDIEELTAQKYFC